MTPTTRRLSACCGLAALALTHPAIAGWPPGTASTVIAHRFVADDGSGPALFARGMFIVAGGELADGLAKWDGDAWSPVGQGLLGEIGHLAAFTDGPRRSLFVAGRIGTAGDGDTYGTFARWGAPFFPGDATGDGAVDVDDLNAVLSGWNTLVVTPGVGGDVTRNGIVDVEDLNAVLSA